MEEVAIKDEPMDYQSAPSETMDTHSKTPQPKESYTTDLQTCNQSYDERNQHGAIFEQIFIKEEPSLLEETNEEELSVHHSNLDVEYSEQEVLEDAEVFNTQEDIEITVDDVKIEAYNSENVTTESRTEVPQKNKGHLLKCSFMGCLKSRHKYPTLQFFGFPIHDTDLCNQWVLNCFNKDLNSMSISALYGREVCENHFLSDSFKNIVRRGLKQDAVPTKSILCSVPDTGEGDKVDLTPLPVEFSSKDVPPKMKARQYKKCSVKGCQRTRESDPSHQFFVFPTHNADLCNQWILNCGDDALHSLRKSLLSRREVCEDHFTQDSIETIRGRILKKDAIPTEPSLDNQLKNNLYVPTEEGKIDELATIPEPSTTEVTEKTTEKTEKNELVKPFTRRKCVCLKRNIVENTVATEEYNIQGNIENTVQNVISLSEDSLKNGKMVSTSSNFKRHSRNVCSFANCGRSKARYPTLHFFSFPVNRPAICDAWIKNCANEALYMATKKTLNSKLVCEKHFEDSCFLSTLKTRLHAWAIPTILSVQDIYDVPKTVVEHIQVAQDCNTLGTPTEQIQVDQESVNPVETLQANFCQLSYIGDRLAGSEARTQRTLFTMSSYSSTLQITQSNPSTAGTNCKPDQDVHQSSVTSEIEPHSRSLTACQPNTVPLPSEEQENSLPTDLNIDEENNGKLRSSIPSLESCSVRNFTGYSVQPSLKQFKYTDCRSDLLKLPSIDGADFEDTVEVLNENKESRDQVCNLMHPTNQITEKGENENFEQNHQAKPASPHNVLFDDVFKSWNLSEINSEFTDLTTHNEESEKDPGQKIPPIEDPTCSSDFPTLEVKESEKDPGQKIPPIEDPTCSSDFPTLEVKTPVRTYKRTATKRQRPTNWGDAENKDEKVGKTIKIDFSKKREDKEERNTLDVACDEGNNEICAGTYTVIVASQKSSPKGENSENALSSTPITIIPKFFQKLHSCLYCKQKVSKIKQHLVENHFNEDELKMTANLNRDARNKNLILLTRIGDFKHNTDVLVKDSGVLIGLGARCHDICIVGKDTFTPCPDCSGFVHVHNLNHHHKCCLFKDKSTQVPVERNVYVESQAMLAYLKKQEFENLTHTLLKRLKSIFGSVAKNDELIMLYIPYLLSSKKCQDVSAILVLIQRLGFILLLYRRIASDQNINFHHILRPESLPLLSKTLNSFFSQHKKSDKLGLYKCLYSHISMGAFIWRGKCLMDGNVKPAQEALQFFYRFTNLYGKEQEIDDLIYNSVEGTRVHVPEKSELTSFAPADIVSFKNSLNERIVKLISRVCDRSVSFVKETIKSLWHDLAEATLCLLSLTNPIEFAAIENLTLLEYAVRPHSAADGLAKYKSMIPSFYRFSEKQILVCTEYCATDIVILLTPTVKRAIDVLITKRKEVGIPITHPNIFSGCYDATLSAMNSFHNLFIKQGSEFLAAVIGDLKKRRYISHIIHISDMSNTEIDLVKKHLKLSVEKKPVLQLSLEDYYNSEIENEFKEALHTYEMNHGSVLSSHNLSEVKKPLNASVM